MEPERESLWKVQCKAMIKRNYLIKWRYKSATIWEFILPVLFMVMFGAINIGTARQGKPIQEWRVEAVSTGSNVSYLPSYTRLLVAPNNTQTQQVTAGVSQRLLCSYTLFDTESDVYAAYSSETNSTLRYPLIGLLFNESQPLFYTIYYVKERGGDQGTVSYNLADCSYGDNCPASKWLQSGIVSLQAAVDAELIKLENSSFVPPIVNSQLMPELQNVLTVDGTLRLMFPLYFVYAMAFLVMYLTYAAVDDKAKNRKDHLTMMGLSPSAYWIAWCVVNIPQALIISLLGTVILIAFSFFSTAGAYAFFFITVLTYAVNNVLLGICWSTILPKTDFVFFALLGTVGLGALGVINVELTDYLTDPSYPTTPWPCALICLIPPACTVAILERMFALNVLYPSLLSSDAFLAGNLSLVGMLGILALDIVLWTLIAMWFDGIMPNSLGGRLPLCFCFNKKYWKPDAVDPNMPDSVELMMEVEDHSDVEAVPRSMKGKEGVRLFHVKKDFTKSSGCGKGETISAVKDVSLDIYEGQITALLGHNGAGKTTLINMMTGIMPVTSGTSKLYGYDVNNGEDLQAIRRMIGVCPQKDVIVERLTVREHLELFARLKGVPADEIPGKIRKTTKDCDLVEQIDTSAEKLSGGQKRKLNIGMALIGDPKVLFLDEPTAGMDPYSRRHLWTLLKNSRAGRVILLTTHFMDEADVLADRKAVISKGRLQCAGSSLYLKNRFGVGYQLTLLVEDTTKQDLLTSAICEVIADSTHKRTFGKEITYNLPIHQTVRFSDLFAALESQKASLSVNSYSIAMITLEEVFLKLGEEAEEQERLEKDRTEGRLLNTEIGINSSNEQGEATDNPINMKKEKVNTTWLRVKHLLLIRLRMVPREGFVLFNMVFYTAALAVGIFLLKISTSGIVLLKTSPPSTLDTNTSIYTADPKFNADTALYHNGTSGAIDSLVGSLKASVSPTLKLVDYDGNYRKSSTPISPLGFDVLNYSSAFAASNITLRYNHTYLNSLPLAMNVLSRSLLAEAVGSTPADTITTSLGEWPSQEQRIHAFNTGSFAGMSFIFAIFMGASLFTIDIVGEKEKKLKPLLRTAGVTVNTYYGSYFLMYMILIGSISIIGFIVVVALPVDAFKAPLAAVLFFLHMIIQLVVILLLSFCWTYAFQRQQSAGNIFNINLWLALLFVTPVTILINIPSVVNAAKILHHLFCFLTPYYGLAGGLLMFTETYRSYLISQNTDHGDIPSVVYIYPENGILSALLGGLMWTFLLFVLLRILEIRSTEGKVSDVFKCFSNSLSLYNPAAVNNDNIADEDDDVVAERAKVAELWQQNTHSQPVVMMANKLRRKFSRSSKKADKVAVRNLTFHVESGQVFGLLGPNGAGKTTVLNMIIAEHSPTAGQVMVDDIEVHSALSDAFTLIGYCPQFDALWQKSTPAELMSFIGISSGYTESQAQAAASYYIKMLKIEEHKDKYIKDLSGGTQRKVSFVLALMGWPRLVLLDEPSTGLDPSSKRFLWDTIRSNFNGHQRAAILTTHYMEEADALCSRIGIMVNGALECIGSGQHIKDKFGDGYQLEIKLKETAEGTDGAMNRLKEFIDTTFPHSTILEEFSDRLQYAMPTDVVDNPGQVFKPLEEQKEELMIEEYSFSQSTLEQVFLQFAKLQLEADEDEENAVKTRAKSHHMLKKQKSVVGASEYTAL